LLVDIGLEFSDARNQLNEINYPLFETEKIIVCSRLGIRSKFYYDKLKNIDADKVKKPYCIIIPGKLNDFEKESLELAAE